MVPPLVITPPADVHLSDENDGIHVTIKGGNATGYQFGGYDPRTGTKAERCLGDGQTICHHLGASGGLVAYDDDCSHPVPGRTCIPELYWRQGIMTFVLRADGSSKCWTWGSENQTYVAALNCQVTTWDPSSYF